MRAIGRHVLRRLLGEERYGALAYRRYPATGQAWGGPMNGQAWRCRLVAELILRFEPAAIVESGTYRGTTTEWLAAFQLPVYSCEASAENIGFSRARLATVSNVHLLHMDSREALSWLLKGPLAGVCDRPILFYLDAHWNDDLPLAEEVDTIFSATRQAIVLIDDFEVPDDPGYAYDDYGSGRALTPDYLVEVSQRHGLAALYPAIPAERETGARRGCAVLIHEETWGEFMKAASLLRRLPTNGKP